jgi:hypothetical protein
MLDMISKAIAMVSNVRVVLRAVMSRNAPSDVKGKLGGDGDGVEGIGVGRLVKADRFISMSPFSEAG